MRFFRPADIYGLFDEVLMYMNNTYVTEPFKKNESDSIWAVSS